MVARHRGVHDIVVSDPVDERRRLALDLGATAACAPDDLRDLLAGRARPSHVLDTVGTQPALDAALGAVAERGVCATAALKPGANRVTVSQTRLLWNRTLLGTIEGDADPTRDIPLLVALWRSGRLPVERLVARYPFAEIARAVGDARAGRVIKPVVVMDAEARASDDEAGAEADRAADGLVAEAGSAAGERAPDLLSQLHAGVIRAAELAALWRSLPPVATAELRGLWRGRGLIPRHPSHRLLDESRWFGKLFRSDDDVAPLVCESADGTLAVDRALAGGGATLREAVHDGLTTAAMVYDGRPIIDLFVRVSPTAVLGVMTGRHAVDADGGLYYFTLEKVADRPVGDARTTPHHSTFKEE